MGFSIELDDETASRLLSKAARLNVDPKQLGLEYVRTQVEKLSELEKTSEESVAARMLTFRRVIGELEAISVRAGSPSLSDEALTRQAIYADHD